MYNEKLMQSLNKYDKCIIPCKSFSQAVDGITECMELTKINRESVNCALLAPPGASKNTIRALFQKKSPSTSRIEQNVIWAEVRADSTPKQLTSALLQALGDPIPEAGTEFEITERVIARIRDSHTALILLNEFHNLLNNTKSTKLKKATCQWLKNLINRTKTTICLIGTQEIYASLDTEISRRFTRYYILGEGAN